MFNAKHVNLGEKATGEMINNFRNFSGMISSKGGGEENSTIKQLVRCATSLPGFLYSGCFQVSTMVLNLNDMAVVHDIVESQIRFTCKFQERNCNGLSKTKRAGTKETIRLPPLYPFYNNTCTLERPQATPWANRGCLQTACKYASLPLQSVFTHVAGSYTNSLQQKKVWISLGYWETAQPPHPQSPSQPFFGCHATLPR